MELDNKMLIQMGTKEGEKRHVFMNCVSRQELARTLPLASLLAPASNSSRMQSTRPVKAAQISADRPSCEFTSQNEQKISKL
jgi:hypothetical protein